MTAQSADSDNEERRREVRERTKEEQREEGRKEEERDSVMMIKKEHENRRAHVARHRMREDPHLIGLPTPAPASEPQLSLPASERVSERRGRRGKGTREDRDKRISVLGNSTSECPCM